MAQLSDDEYSAISSAAFDAVVAAFPRRYA